MSTCKSLGSILEDGADAAPQNTAIICGAAAISYAELDRTTTALARWLLQQGLRTGDRVAIHWANSVEIVTLCFACFKAGVIAVPVNIRLKPAEVEYVLRHSEASICFSQPYLAHIAEQAIAAGNLAIPLRSDLPRETDLAGVLPEVIPTDPCIILYTSGTTAHPKGAIHTHASLFHSGRMTLLLFDGPGTVAMATTQVSHMSGICALMACLLNRRTVLLLPAFEPALALDSIERFRVNHVVSLPLMLELMVVEQAQRPRDVSSLQNLSCGGDSLPVPLQQRLEDTFGVPVIEVIGMTESCPAIWNTAQFNRAGSVGKTGADVKIEGNYGNDGVGEMLVRSPANFIGYWRDTEATVLALRDGWLHTGDLVRQDSDGYLWFSGRLKQIIIRGGSNIAPQEVEEVLYAHPSVLQACAVGVPHPLFGQGVAAYVALKETATASTQELRDFARERLADYKLPENIWFLPELPRGLTGKIDRRALAERALRDIQGHLVT